MSSRPPVLWLPLLAGAALGGLVGVATSFVYQTYDTEARLQALETRLLARIDEIPRSTTSTTSTPNPTITPIPVQSKSLLEDEGVMLASRASTVGRLRRLTAAKDDASLDLGQVVSVTADGWLVTTISAVNALRLADLRVIINNHVYTVEKGVKDSSTGFAYLKIAARDLPVAAFAAANEVSRGQLVFAEPWQRFELQTVASVRAREDVASVSSEVTNRRFLVTGQALTGRAGMAIWDRAGRLIGLAERADAEGVLVIPASHINASLSSVINDGVVKRASLGVRSLELATLAPDLTPAPPSTRGAWLKANRTLPAIAPTGPAAKVLQDGDVIERIDRDVLDGNGDLGERLLDYRSGSRVTVYGLRDGNPFEAQVTLGSVTTSELLK